MTGPRRIKTNMRIVFCLLLSLLMAGCVTPHTTHHQASVKLNEFRRINLIVTDAVGSSYSKESLPLFEGLLRGKLQSNGYTLVATNAELSLHVAITACDAGNRTLRTLIGFGAGRAVLKFTASFKDSEGQLLAEFEGGKSYHGVELVDNPTFKSDESTNLGLISYSISQIGNFLEKNGEL